MRTENDADYVEITSGENFAKLQEQFDELRKRLEERNARIRELEEFLGVMRETRLPVIPATGKPITSQDVEDSQT